MPRAANPYYVDSDPYPTNQAVTSMGQSLGTALFGDPQAAQEQRLKVAQAQTAAAEADNYRATAAKTAAETTGLGLQNDATANLGATFGDLFGPDGKLDYHKWARASAGAVASHNTEALKGLDRVVAQFGNEDEARRVLGVVDIGLVTEEVLEGSAPPEAEDVFEALGFHLAAARNAGPFGP